MPDAAKSCQAAADQVKKSLAPFMKTTTKAADSINNVNTKMSKYIGPNPTAMDDNLFMDDYYNKEKKQLQNNLKNYKTNISRYPDQLAKAELKLKKFDIFGDPDADRDSIKKKLDTYKGQLKNNFTNIANSIMANSLAQHENYNRDLQTMIIHYRSQEAYSKRMQNLLDTKQAENKKMQDELEKLTKKGLTYNRKAIYEDYEIETLNSIRNIMFYIYYIIFILYLIFGNFFTNKEYRSVSVWIYMTLYLAAPFYLKYITNGIVYVYREILYIKDNKLPKNVYTDI